MPFYIWLSITVAFPVSKVVKKIKGKDVELTLDNVLNFLGMLYSALYIPLVKNVLAYYECVPNPAALDTLAKYKQIVCNSSEHDLATPAMVLGIMLYVIGFYSLCVYINVLAPARFISDKVFRVRAKFLVNRWRVDVWYWGTVYMTRALFLAMVTVVSSTAVDQFIMMIIVMVFFLVFAALFMPWKDERLAQFDNLVSVIIIFAACCGIGFMHLQTQKAMHQRDPTERGAKMMADLDQRMGMYSILLGMALAIAFFLFCGLVGYCLWWVQNMKRRTALEQEKIGFVIERYGAIKEHPLFDTQFKRFVETGTHYDIRSLVTFLDEMQSRVGGMEGLRKSARASKRLRVSVAVSVSDLGELCSENRKVLTATDSTSKPHVPQEKKDEESEKVYEDVSHV